MELLTAPVIDLHQLVSYRLDRLQRQLAVRDCTAALLFDPINVYYALGTIRYPVFQFHLPSAEGIEVVNAAPCLERARSSSRR